MGQVAMETPESHQRKTATFNYSLQRGDLKSLEAREQWLLKLGKNDTGVEIMQIFVKLNGREITMKNTVV